MNQNILELFQSNNMDDLELAFILAQITNTPIKMVNAVFALLVKGNNSLSLVEKYTDFTWECPRMELDEECLEIPGVRESLRFIDTSLKPSVYQFISKWKEDETPSNI